MGTLLSSFCQLGLEVVLRHHYLSSYTFEIHNQLESSQEDTKNSILLWFLLDSLFIRT